MSNYETFVKWCNDNDAILSNLSLETYKNSERGIHSINGIKRGRTLIEIPEKLLITDKMGEDTVYGRIIKKHSKYFKNLKIIYVVLYILETKKDNHFFKPYYDILPTSLSNFPIFWNKEDIILLTGSNSINEIIIRQKEITKDYEKICELIPEFKNKYSIQTFIWARTIVGSRNFGIVIDNVSRSAMVPICDLLNHDPKPDVTWGFNQRTRSFKMVSNRYLKKGKPITDTYGIKSNLKYLLFYGFTIENNYKNDVIYINLVHGNNNMLFKNSIKKQVTGYLSTNINSTLFHDIMLFLRVAVSDNEILKNNKIISYYQKPINIDNEKLAIKAFKKYLNTKLKNYKFFNVKSKNNYDKFSIKWNCCNLIMGEINIILYYIDYLNNIEGFLNGKSDLLNIKESIYRDMIKNII